MRFLMVLIGLLLASSAQAQEVTPQTACPMPKGGWPERPSFTCAELNEETITSLEGVTRSQVETILGSPGQCSLGGAMCHYDDWNVAPNSFFGEITVYYDSAGDARHVEAHAEQAARSPFASGYILSDDPNPSYEVIWDNVMESINCSDFSAEPRSCK